MEHVVQIGINVDDETIQRSVINNVTKIVEKAIFPNGISTYSYYNNSLSKDFKDIVESCVYNFLETLKDDIVKESSTQIANKLCASKKFKEAVTTIIASGESDE